MPLPFDHFDLIARWYDRLIARPVDDPLPGLLALAPGQIVLDVGGGTGRTSHGLRAAGAKIIVCDFAAGMARQAHAKGLPAVQGSAAQLPFSDAAADRVLVVDAFHHFVHPTPAVAQPRAAAELLRVVKPGGRLVVEEPNIMRAGVKAIALAEKALMMGSRFLTPAQMVALFEAAGARTVVVEAEGFSTQWVFTK